MYYLVGKNADVDKRIVTENHPVVQMHIKEAIELGVTPRVPEEIIKWMWGIEKKSDNVFDLIEVGDLVKTGIGKIFDVRKPYIDKGLAIIPFHILFLNKINITAIYKPNSKGDYIKVWECEE